MAKRSELREENFADPQGRPASVRDLITSARRQPPLERVATEWAGIAETTRLFGLSRPRLFKLIALGQVDSVHIKDPGKKKGIRLVYLPSVRAYIRSFTK
jgi:hypothetical protein